MTNPDEPLPAGKPLAKEAVIPETDFIPPEQLPAAEGLRDAMAHIVDGCNLKVELARIHDVLLAEQRAAIDRARQCFRTKAVDVLKNHPNGELTPETREVLRHSLAKLESGDDYGLVTVLLRGILNEGEESAIEEARTLLRAALVGIIGERLNQLEKTPPIHVSETGTTVPSNAVS
jgi:hypothetical protein